MYQITCTRIDLIFSHTETFDTKASKDHKLIPRHHIYDKNGRSKIGCRWTEQPLGEEIGRLSLYICFKRPGEIVQKSMNALIFTLPARLNVDR
jgi:hypothetical protein